MVLTESAARQVVLTVAQMVWCRDVHAVLDGDHDRISAMKAFEGEMFQVGEII